MHLLFVSYTTLGTMHYNEFITCQRCPSELFDAAVFVITRDDECDKRVTLKLKSIENNVVHYSIESSNWPGFDYDMWFCVMNKHLLEKGRILVVN